MEKYIAVYYQAYGDLGRMRAGKLFPVIRSVKRKTVPIAPASQEPVSAAA